MCIVFPTFSSSSTMPHSLAFGFMPDPELCHVAGSLPECLERFKQIFGVGALDIYHRAILNIQYHDRIEQPVVAECAVDDQPAVRVCRGYVQLAAGQVRKIAVIQREARVDVPFSAYELDLKVGAEWCRDMGFRVLPFSHVNRLSMCFFMP